MSFGLIGLIVGGAFYLAGVNQEVLGKRLARMEEKRELGM